MSAGGDTKVHVEQPGPAEFHDPVLRRELQRAWVWIGSLLFVAALIFLAQPLLLIVDDLDAACDLIGPDRISPPKDAVQPGRRIATVRSDAGLEIPVALMTG